MDFFKAKRALTSLVCKIILTPIRINLYGVLDSSGC